MPLGAAILNAMDRAAGSERAAVLVVDDDEDIAELMRDFLEAAGYHVLTCGDGEAALRILAECPVDAVLLDVMMPGPSGFEVLRTLRTDGHELPVLFLSARQEDADKIRGLGLGADDYIVKSATPAEVVARVRAVLRRASGARSLSGDEALTFGSLRIDPAAREVTLDGRVVSLTAREFDLLELLARHPRQALPRETLFERLWGQYGDRHSLTVHIARLREKLEADPSDPLLIVTVRGVGYRFEGRPGA